MKVEGPNSPRTAQVKRKTTSGVAGSSFADALEGESGAASPASASGMSGTSSAASVSTILALQAAEAEEGDAAAERNKQRAEDLLRQLDLLRLDILTGSIPRDHLIGLAQSIKTSREKIFDPRLTEILDEIDLRAQVELAKYDPYR